MKLLANSHRIKNHFTMEYSPWANDIVKSVNRHVKAAARALNSEFKLAPNDWPDVTPLIQ